MQQTYNGQSSSDVGQASQTTPSTDIFSAYLDTFVAMQSAMLSCLPIASEVATKTTPSSHQYAATPSSDEQSWYRRPLETPVGDYMHGSGMFLPGGVFAGFIETAAKTQTDLAMQMMAYTPSMASGPAWNNQAWTGLPMYNMPMNGMPMSQTMPGFPGIAAGMTGIPGLPTPVWPMQMWGMPSASSIPGLHGLAPWGSASPGSSFFPNELGRAITEFWSAAINMAPAMTSSMLETYSNLLGTMLATATPAQTQPESRKPPETTPASPRAVAASYRSAGGHATSTIAEHNAPQTDVMRMATLPMELGLSSLMMFTNFAGGATRRS